MIDISLLRLLKYREQYDRLYRSLPEAGLDARTKTILEDFGAWFGKFPESPQIELASFETWFLGIKHPAIGKDPEKAKYYRDVIKNIQPDLEEHIEQGLREQLLELDNATRIANLVDKYASGDDINIMREVSLVVEEHGLALDKKIECKWVDPDLGELLAESANTDGLKFRLTVLHEHMRGLQGGDLVLVSGRPDSGKTSFLASEITYMAQQLPDDRPIIWFNNEGPGKRILLRIYQAALGCKLSELGQLYNSGRFWEEYEAALGGPRSKIRVKDIHDFYFYEVEDIIREYKPGLVVMDMIDNIKFTNLSGAARTDQVLEAMYQQTRNLGVKYDCPILATSQISNEGDGLLYPTKGMLKDSKCFAKDTPVRMFDGSIKMIQDIQLGEQVMGIDGTARNVVGTGHGEEPMFRVSGKGWHFDCNLSHNLVVQNRTHRKTAGLGHMEMRDMSLCEFMDRGSSTDRLAAVRCRIPYEHRHLPMSPYLLGLWLGDGAARECRITSGDSEILEYLESLPTYRSTYKQASNCSDVYFGPRIWLDAVGVRRNKHIPQAYKISSIQQRLELLAGLMDSDGTIDHGSSVISMSEKRAGLVNDIAEVARSLGYRVSIRRKPSTNSVSVTFAPTDRLPCLLSRKVYVCKDQGDRMKVEPLGWGEYFGITVDGDSRYCHADYIALRNTGKQGACDTMIMIGQPNDINSATVRGISTPKNKLKLEGKPSCPQEEVRFLMDIARYADALEN